MALDDTVFWGALPELKRAPDAQIAEYAMRLSDRKLPKCFDVLAYIQSKSSQSGSSAPANSQESRDKSTRIQATVKSKIEEWIQTETSKDKSRLLLLDDAKRDPYKKFSQSKGALNQIYVQPTKGQTRDLAEVSPMVANLMPFQLLRVYFTDNSRSKTEQELQKLIDEIIQKENSNG